MSKDFDLMAPKVIKQTVVSRKLLPIERATGMTEAQLEAVAQQMRETAHQMLTMALLGKIAPPAHSGKALPDRRAGAGKIIDQDGKEVTSDDA